MTRISYTAPPAAIPTLQGKPNDELHRRLLAEGQQRIMEGRTNNVIEVTLAASEASTTVTDSRITFQSALLPMPRTANAAAEIAAGTMYVADSGRVNGSAVIVHANNSQTDRDFLFVIVG